MQVVTFSKQFLMHDRIAHEDKLKDMPHNFLQFGLNKLLFPELLIFFDLIETED
jgi:hypothetical protein